MISSFTTETAYLRIIKISWFLSQTSPGIIRTLIVMVTTNTTCNFEGHHS